MEHTIYSAEQGAKKKLPAARIATIYTASILMMGGNLLLTPSAQAQLTKFVCANPSGSADGATATKNNSVACGTSAKAEGEGDTAFGYMATTGTLGSATAVGSEAKASNSNSTAVGQGAQASGSSSTSLGSLAVASGDQTIAVGAAAQATKLDAVSIGVDAMAIGEGSTALGRLAKATKNATTALGSSAIADGANATAVGVSTIASGSNSTAVGRRAQALGSSSTSLGFLAVASGDQTIAVGAAAQATKLNAISLGVDAKASAESALALGRSSKALDQSATALGSFTTAEGVRATAVGESSSAEAVQATALGAGARSSGSNSVALGAGSVATEVNTVSIGGVGRERRIVNLASGVAPTDAVNVGQFNAGIDNAKQYTDERVKELTGLTFKNLRELSHQVNKRANAMGAMAMGAASNAGVSSCTDWRKCLGRISVGIGHLDGEMAGAITYSRPLGGRVHLNLNAGFADGEVGSSIGIGYEM